jgi:hypothetical protein
VHHPALGLRDGLLCHDDDVAVLELNGPGDQGAEVLSLPDLREAFDGDDR